MLDLLRKAASTWVSKLLLIVLVGSFAIWGVSSHTITGVGRNNVLSAGDTVVSLNDYRLAYERQLNALSQRLGQRLTRDQAASLGLDDQVLAQLLSGALLDEEARHLNLGLSRDRVAALTAEDPAFKGPDGRFSRQQFDFVLRQAGMRAEDYFLNREKVAVRQQIVEATADGIKPPAAFLNALALYRGEDRTVDYLTLPRSLVEPVAAPADSVLTSWFEERKKDYAAPEYRKLNYVKLQPEDIADESAISDDQVRKDYEANKGRYTTPETRTLEQLVFPSREAADAAHAAIAGGQSFEDAVAAAGRTMADVQLGTFAHDRVPDQKVADAAFKVTAGGVSDVVDGSFGPVIVRATAITPETVRSYEEVAHEIRKDLALGEARRVLLDAHDQYEDARAGGASMTEAAEKLKLDVVVIDAVDLAGRRPDGTVISDIPASAEVLRAAFESEVGVENAAIPLGNDGYVYFEIESITQARDRTLDEVRDKVLADWKTAETRRLLTEKAADIQKRVKDGSTLDAVAGELSLEKQVKRGVKRDTDDADFGRDGVTAIFGVAEKGVGVLPAPAGDAQIVFQVTEVFEPAASGPEAIAERERNAFASGLADDLLDQLVARLQTQVSVSVDRAAVDRAKSF